MNTVLFVLLAVLAVVEIFWLVIYAGRRGEEHRQRTTIKPNESQREGGSR